MLIARTMKIKLIRTLKTNKVKRIIASILAMVFYILLIFQFVKVVELELINTKTYVEQYNDDAERHNILTRGF